MQEVFLVTRVPRGESADSAYQEMLTDYRACQLVQSVPSPDAEQSNE